MENKKTSTVDTNYQENAEEEPQIFAVSEIENDAKFSRRDFLELAAASTAVATLASCNSENEEIPKPASTPIHVPVAVVKVDQATLRSEPGETEFSDEITELKRFDVLTVTARNSDASWFRVESSTDTVGWVITDSVVFRFPIDTIPIAGIVKEPNEGLRVGPGTEYDIVTALAAGTVLMILARDKSGDWFKAKTKEEKTGWVRKVDLVATTANVNSKIKVETNRRFEASLDAMPVLDDHPPKPTPPPPPTKRPDPKPPPSRHYWRPN